MARTSRPVTIRGKRYPSRSAAAAELGVTYKTIAFAEKQGKLETVGLRKKIDHNRVYILAIAGKTNQEICDEIGAKDAQAISGVLWKMGFRRAPGAPGGRNISANAEEVGTVPSKRRARMVRMRSAGHSIGMIASETGFSPHIVHAVVQDVEICPRKEPA